MDIFLQRPPVLVDALPSVDRDVAGAGSLGVGNIGRSVGALGILAGQWGPWEYWQVSGGLGNIGRSVGPLGIQWNPSIKATIGE